MRIAIVSDVHGNLAALEAVVADLERVQPDLVLHGGDLAVSGPRPAEVIDLVRELGWPGVVGNWDVIFGEEGEQRIHALPARFRAVFEPIVSWTRNAIGPERIAWLAQLPREQRRDDLVLLHASPSSLWSAPPSDAAGEELIATFGGLGCERVVYAHIHQPFVRRIGFLTVANSGSVGLPLDGDWRASYLLIEGGQPEVRRVEYDVEREVRDLYDSGHPAPDFIAKEQRTGRVVAP